MHLDTYTEMTEVLILSLAIFYYSCIWRKKKKKANMLLKQIDYVLNMFFYLCISEIDLGLLWALFMLFLQLIYN